MIFGLLDSQKPFVSTFVQPYVFRMKEKGVVTEGEQVGLHKFQPNLINPLSLAKKWAKIAT